MATPALFDEGSVKAVTKAEKVKYWSQPVTDEIRHEIQDVLDTFADATTAVDISEKRVMNSDEADALMSEAVAIQELEAVLAARNARIKQMVFNHIEAEARENRRENPQHSTGSIVVPGWGKRFVREGGGTEEPTLDAEKFRSLVPENVWKKVTTKTKIPARVVEDVDREKLDEYIQRNPDLMDVVQQALVEGARRSPKFNVRDIK